MRSFALTSLLTMGCILVACSTPAVDGDALGGESDGTDAPPRATQKDAGTSTTDPTTPPAAVTTTATLTVTMSGVGNVTSSPAGLSCAGSTCTGQFPRGASVTLSQTSTAGILFGGWGGPCTGSSACSVTMDAAKTVTASFVAVEGTWTGTYTNTRTANGCTFNNGGNVTMKNVASNGSLASSANVDGLEIRQIPGCGLVGKVKGSSNGEGLSFGTNELTGLWTVNVSGGGQLPFPFKAKLDGDKLSGTWTCTGCTGGFTLTKSP